MCGACDGIEWFIYYTGLMYRNDQHKGIMQTALVRVLTVCVWLESWSRRG